MASGLLNKQIGGELGISEITRKVHRGQVIENADEFPRRFGEDGRETRSHGRTKGGA